MSSRYAFEIAGGSLTGRAHVLSCRNNQDAFHVAVRDGVTVALVADGCGSGRHSEVGAQLGVRLLAEALHLEARHEGAAPEAVLEGARLSLLSSLGALAGALHSDPRERPALVADTLLFTLVGAVLTPEWTAVFALGDGLVYVNGERFSLECAANTPPYLAYGLTGSSLTDTRPELLRFRILRLLPTSGVESLLLGTDGVGDLERAGGFRDLWTSDRTFANPHAVTRHLHRAARAGRTGGVPLPDDTTLVVLRRRCA